MPEMTERQPNRMPWLALLLVLIAVALNFGFFVGFPAQRALPWLSLLCGLAALFLSAIAVKRAYSRPQLYTGKISSSIIAVLSILVCALLAFATVESRSLPSGSAAPQIGQKAPDFTLPDTQGKQVSLTQLLDHGSAGAANSAAPKAVLLVFYRGYW
jgi:AhpC/TSA family